MNLTAVGDTDLAPLGVIEGVELDEHVFVDGVAWVVFTRHRLTCPAGVDPSVCGCVLGGNLDGYHVYAASPDTPGAVPIALAHQRAETA